MLCCAATVPNTHHSASTFFRVQIFTPFEDDLQLILHSHNEITSAENAPKRFLKYFEAQLDDANYSKRD